MPQTEKLTAARLADILGATVEGDGAAVIRAGAPISSAGPGDITYVAKATLAKELGACNASAVLVGADVPVPPSMTALRLADPEAGFVRVLGMLAPAEDFPLPGVHPSAVVEPSARLAAGVAVGANAYVGANTMVEEHAVVCAGAHVGSDCRIGACAVLMSGVVVRERCTIGKRTRIHPNAVIGADGFGYIFRNGAHVKVPQVGTVEIGDDVEIGACTCVDRGKTGATRIGDGTKIDNLCQIAHNIRIGRHVVIAGASGVAGSAEIGDYVVIGGNAGVSHAVRVGTGARIAGGARVFDDVPDGQAVMGSPAVPVRTYVRVVKDWERISDLRKTVRELQDRLDAIETAAKNDREER